MESELRSQRAYEAALRIPISRFEAGIMDAAEEFWCGPWRPLHAAPPEEWEAVEQSLIERLASLHGINPERARAMVSLALIGADYDEIWVDRESNGQAPPEKNHGGGDGKGA